MHPVIEGRVAQARRLDLPSRQFDPQHRRFAIQRPYLVRGHHPLDARLRGGDFVHEPMGRKRMGKHLDIATSLLLRGIALCPGAITSTQFGRVHTEGWVG